MPLDYQLLLLAHLLAFVYWLGGDLGVFYSSFVVADAKRGVEARVTAARILIALDQVPRICLVLILPIGLTLAGRLGLVPIGPAATAAIWGGSLLWLALVVTLHLGHSAALGRIDTLVRITVAATALAVAVAALTGNGITASGWVAAKLGIFGLIVGCGLAIRAVFAPFASAFAALAASGSSPDIEKTIQRSLGRARPFVISIWALLIAAAWLGLAKPVLQ